MYVKNLRFLAHGRYLTDIDSFPSPLNSPKVNQGCSIELKADYCTLVHCSVLRKLQGKAVLRASTCHSPALSSSISPVWGENVSRKWGVSWVPEWKSMTGLVRAETNTKFPGQPITGSSRDRQRLLTLLPLLTLDKQGNKARMSSGQWWRTPSWAQAERHSLGPAHSQPGSIRAAGGNSWPPKDNLL